MKKIDFKNELKQLYKPSAKKIEVVQVPEMNFLMIDGAGDPNTSQNFSNAIEALYSVSYTLKFTAKKGPLSIDFTVMPIEGLWWAEDMRVFETGNKDTWQWTLMIMQPEFISQAMIEQAIQEVQRKKNPVALSLVRFESFDEGKAVQTMHLGPFTEEGPTIEKVHAFIAQQGHERRGKHHEIYLSDTRRTAPEKWKTIVRQPMT